MNVNEVKRIKELIGRAEIESAKAKGVMEQIEEGWKKKYGTSDFHEIKSKRDSMKEALKEKQNRMDTLYNELVSSYDWDSLEEELDGR